MSVTTLFLSPDNPSNTIITDDLGRILYFVETSYPDSKTVTTVRDANKNKLAALEWRDVLSDRITFGLETKQIAINDWLKKSRIPFNSTVTFTDDLKRGYKWKGYGSGEQLELYADDADPSSPIARFQMSRKSSDRPAALLLDARALEIRDIVVLSFLFLEKSRRATHNSTQHKADVLGTPYVSPNNFQAIKNGGV